ncbi:uncharacterized protein LOC130844622 [Hippopotamus amphibius kiboko]|uniref:uncharacterized protein LOC130844622 n=1 Tax=Hippopotamus amphibius kiboko TaxID=575201 RepID=UPI002596F911|nr:uncharacterized protein LOC130844622 [Hippopotamus amphibius kiboko]
MLSAARSVLVIFLIFRGTNGDSVNQTEGPVTLSEGALMTLNCTYETTALSPYLFWYVQYLNKAPQLLLESLKANKMKEQQGFQATLVKTDRSFHLRKPSVQTSDSAVYYCAVSDTVRGAAGGAEHKPKGSRRAEKTASSISLAITALQLGDSAVYFCALRDRSDAGACGRPTETSDLNMRRPPAVNTLVGLSWSHGFSIDVSGRTGAQSVTQPDGHITGSKGPP